MISCDANLRNFTGQCATSALKHHLMCEGVRYAGALVDERSLDHRDVLGAELIRSFSMHHSPCLCPFGLPVVSGAEVWGLITFVTNFIPNLGAAWHGMARQHTMASAVMLRPCVASWQRGAAPQILRSLLRNHCTDSIRLVKT